MANGLKSCTECISISLFYVKAGQHRSILCNSVQEYTIIKEYEHTLFKHMKTRQLFRTCRIEFALRITYDLFNGFCIYGIMIKILTSRCCFIRKCNLPYPPSFKNISTFIFHLPKSRKGKDVSRTKLTTRSIYPEEMSNAFVPPLFRSVKRSLFQITKEFWWRLELWVYSFVCL